MISAILYHVCIIALPFVVLGVFALESGDAGAWTESAPQTDWALLLNLLLWKKSSSESNVR